MRTSDRAVVAATEDPTGGPVVGASLRWSRAVVLAAVVLGCGSLAHLLAGGLLPGADGLGALLLGTVAVSGALLGRPATTRRVVLLVVSGQLVVHGALTAMAGHAGDPPLRRDRSVTPQVPLDTLPTGADRTGTFYDVAYADRVQAPDAQLVLPAPVQHVLADLTGPHALMGLAHLLAAAVVGLWLASGERALWVLLALGARATHAVVLQLWSRCVLALVASATTHRRALRVLATATWRTRPPRSVLLAHSLARRGPPALVTA